MRAFSDFLSFGFNLIHSLKNVLSFTVKFLLGGSTTFFMASNSGNSPVNSQYFTTPIDQVSHSYPAFLFNFF